MPVFLNSAGNLLILRVPECLIDPLLNDLARQVRLPNTRELVARLHKLLPSVKHRPRPGNIDLVTACWCIPHGFCLGKNRFLRCGRVLVLSGEFAKETLNNAFVCIDELGRVYLDIRVRQVLVQVCAGYLDLLARQRVFIVILLVRWEVLLCLVARLSRFEGALVFCEGVCESL